jgi:Tfp pilus assembly PilM family ATPase
MSSALIKEKAIKYFTQPPVLHSSFYFSSGYVSGIHLSPKEKRLKSYFFSPLESGVIEPSFAKKNIKNAALLEEKLKEGLEKIHLSDKKTACLIPELSLKAFVFSFDSLPPSAEEKQKILRFRIKKQMGFVPQDIRLSFQQIRSNRTKKLLVSLARSAVIEEYEDLLSRLGIKVRAVGSPLLGLFNIMNMEKDEDFLLVNIEKDSLSLLAVISSEITLYRQKPLSLGQKAASYSREELENVVNEVENTAHFIEDREKKKIKSFFIRLGLPNGEEEVFSYLQEKWLFPLRRVDVVQAENSNHKEREILAPLAGQIL